MQLAHRFELLVALVAPRDKHIAFSSFLDLNPGQNVPIRRPGQLLEWFARLYNEVVEVVFDETTYPEQISGVYVDLELQLNGNFYIHYVKEWKNERKE